MSKVTIEIAAKELGFVKVKGRWYTEFYLDMLDCTPYELGAEVYISDGETIQESGLTTKEVIQEYKDYVEDMKNEGF